LDVVRFASIYSRRVWRFCTFLASRVALGVSVPFSRWRLGSRLDPGRWTCRCRERHRESAHAARTACWSCGFKWRWRFSREEA
jgi:hypothetical protein